MVILTIFAQRKYYIKLAKLRPQSSAFDFAPHPRISGDIDIEEGIMQAVHFNAFLK